MIMQSAALATTSFVGICEMGEAYLDGGARTRAIRVKRSSRRASVSTAIVLVIQNEVKAASRMQEPTLYKVLFKESAV